MPFEHGMHAPGDCLEQPLRNSPGWHGLHGKHSPACPLPQPLRQKPTGQDMALHSFPVVSIAKASPAVARLQAFPLLP